MYPVNKSRIQPSRGEGGGGGGGGIKTSGMIEGG